MEEEIYKGWYIYRSDDAWAIWAGCEWGAYKGGVDLDAPRISGRTLEEVKAEIDDEEGE